MEVILFTVGAPQSKKVVILFIVGWMMLKTPPKMLLYIFRSTTFKKVVILFWHTACKKVAILFRVDAVTTGSWTSLMFAAAHNHVSMYMYHVTVIRRAGHLRHFLRHGSMGVGPKRVAQQDGAT